MKVKVLSSVQFACLFFLVISSVLDTVWKTKVLANKCSKAKIIEPLNAVKTNWKHYGDIPSEKIGQNIHPPKSFFLSLIINTGLVQVHFGYF